MEKVLVCSHKQLEKDRYIIKFIQSWKDELIVFINNNKIKIFSSICVHNGGQIHYSEKENKLECNWHKYNFCKDTGKCLTYNIKGFLREYESLLENENIFAIRK